MSNFREKYLKYKAKYMTLRTQIGGKLCSHKNEYAACPVDGCENNRDFILNIIASGMYKLNGMMVDMTTKMDKHNISINNLVSLIETRFGDTGEKMYEIHASNIEMLTYIKEIFKKC